MAEAASPSRSGTARPRRSESRPISGEIVASPMPMIRKTPPIATARSRARQVERA